MEFSPPELPDLRPVNPTPFPTNPPRFFVNPPSHCNPVLNPVSSIPLPRNPVQFNPLPAQQSLDIPMLANPILSNALSPPNSHPNPANPESLQILSHCLLSLFLCLMTHPLLLSLCQWRLIHYPCPQIQHLLLIIIHL